METGVIFDIQGYSVHDGPGCRTLVFLSGCPLHCAWCANPEGQLNRSRLMYRASKCIHSHYYCINACHKDAITINDNPPLSFKRTICNTCTSMDCVQACINEALKISGSTYTVDELMRVMQRDQHYWGDQGGVTFTGGEPLLQAEFLLAALKICRSHYIHTAIETCAHVNTDVLLKILDWTDWLFIDLKHTSPIAHQKETGVSNELIMRNIEAVSSSNWDGRLIMRTPVIPGYNDNEENFHAIVKFMKKLNLHEINLLSFYRLGSSKYNQLGLKYKYATVEPPLKEKMQEARSFFETAGLICYIDYEPPF